MTALVRWSSSHRGAVIGIWVIALLASVAVTRGVGTRFVNNLTLPGTDAQRASDVLTEHLPRLAGDSDQIVFHATAGRLGDPSIRGRIYRTLREVAKLPHVTGVTSPFSTAHDRSRDGTIGFATVSFDRRGDAVPVDAVKHVIAVAQSARSAELQVALGGSAIQETQRPTLGAATAIGIVAAMVILFLCFGSFLAMALPILMALFGLGASVGIIALLTHVLDTPDFASELALLIGLGVGVDYALFVVTRYRDRFHANGGDVGEALVTAMETAGRSIVFAGLTVVVSVLGLVVVGVPLLYGVALATSLSVLLVLAASLTLLPALVTLFGERVGQRRALRRRATLGPQRGVWHRWIALIQRRPALAAFGATAVLLALAAPVLGLRLAASDASNDRASTTTRQAYDLLSRGFGQGFNGPLQVVVRLEHGPIASPLARLSASLAAVPGVASVAPPRVSARRDAAAITVFPSSAPESRQTYDLVKDLRTRVIPPIENATGITVYVGGVTASQVDFANVLSENLPLFIGVVILLAGVLLLVVFRSLLIPLQAAVMNLLSIGAALGVVQAIFERGWASGLLGVSRSPIEAFIPVIVFAIVFGLSMDYEVFLVARIREEWLASSDHDFAIREGLAGTSRVITAAAAIMIVVFGSFAASDSHLLKLFGISLVAAIFLDAVVIRSILLPAVLQLLGRATWRFPRWLDRRLPTIAIDAPARLEALVEPQPSANL
jgi:RND superfamily putative drug exporter